MGPALLPEVSTALGAAANDEQRHCRSTLRYRLAASHALVAAWPDGIDRLADLNSDTRHLPSTSWRPKRRRATAHCCWSCLPTPIRSSARPACACSRPWAARSPPRTWSGCCRTPSPTCGRRFSSRWRRRRRGGMDAEVIKFVQTEKDPDLVVHAVRILREQDQGVGRRVDDAAGTRELRQSVPRRPRHSENSSRTKGTTAGPSATSRRPTSTPR